jgi:ubiquinone/menaquinone biosynthesis C-methylase UbiE
MNFDEKAKDWDKDPLKLERAKVFAGEILKILGSYRPETAVEYGSGTGLVSFQLKNEFRSIILADTSRGMMEVLEEKAKRENLTSFRPMLIKDSAELLSLPPADVVYTLLTLHHVKDLDTAFSVFGRIIKKGGYLFIGDLVTEDGSFHYRDPEFDGHKGFSTADLNRRLAKEGFESITDKIFYTIKRSDNGEIKEYPLFIIALKKK